MNKFCKQIPLALVLTVCSSNFAVGQITENQPAAVVPATITKDGILGVWKPKLGFFMGLASLVVKIDYTLYILEDRVIVQQKCLDSGLTASIESEVVITDTTIEALDSQTHKVVNTATKQECELSAVPAKDQYVLGSDGNSLTIIHAKGEKEYFTRAP